MANLRIHLTKYRNRGMANKKLKGQQEHHVIFKFDTEPEAKDFIAKVKDWYYSLESIKDKVINEMNKDAPETQTTKRPARRKPGPAKGTGGRPKKDI